MYSNHKRIFRIQSEEPYLVAVRRSFSLKATETASTLGSIRFSTQVGDWSPSGDVWK